MNRVVLRLALFVVGLVVVFGLAFAAGALVGPVDGSDHHGTDGHQGLGATSVAAVEVGG